MKRLKIWWIRRKLRAAYHRSQAWKNDMDCGYTMACYIRPEIKEHEEEFERLAVKLAELCGTTHVRFFS